MCVTLLLWTQVSLAEDIPPLEFPQIQALHFGIFKRLPGSCWCFQGNCVIGKADLNGGCQRGKLSAATGIHFTL